MCYQEPLSIGIQPLAVCQSMDRGYTAESVTTDTFFFLRKCAVGRNVIWCESKELDLGDVASIKGRCD